MRECIGGGATRATERDLREISRTVRSAVRLRVEGRGIVVLVVVVMHTGTFSRFWIHRSRGARFFRWKSLLKERGLVK